MKNTLSDQLPYSMRIEWSNENQVFVVSLPEWGDLVHTHGATYEEALRLANESPHVKHAGRIELRRIEET